MEPKRIVLGALTQIIEHRINQSTTRLLQHPQIQPHVQRNPQLKHVLRMALARGAIPEHGGVEKAREVIQQALHGAEIANKLETRIKMGVGKPPRPAQELQETLQEAAHSHDQAKTLIQNATFATYLRKMALNLHALGHQAQDLRKNTLLTQAILDYVTTEYQLMKELGVPNSIIKNHAHKFSIFQANDIYKDCHREFGDNEDTESLVRTAAYLLFQKQFANAQEAKQTYQKHLQQAEETFGGDPETKPLVRTIALMLFKKQFANAQEAKQTYQKHLQQAEETFGGNEDTESLVRTAAYLLFQNKFPNAKEAKQTYQKHLKAAKAAFGRDPEIAPLIRTIALMLFQNKFPNVKEAKQTYQKHLKAAEKTFGRNKDSKKLVRTAAYLLFQNKFPNAKEAKQTYQKHLQQAEETYGRGPETKRLVRKTALMLFQKRLRRLKKPNPY